MIYLLSPAKTLDYDTPVPSSIAAQASAPQYTEQAAKLIAVLKKKTPRQISKLMDLSANLAELNVSRYAAWTDDLHAATHKPALLAFNGDVYDGLDAKSLSAADITWANAHIVILSGLYGALRPLDKLQPYRLEMGTALRTRKGANLYAFWGDAVAQHLNTLQATEAAPTVVNLASIEYAKVALRKTLQANVIHCTFEDRSPSALTKKASQDDYKVISFFAKKARGLMARWAVQNKVNDPDRLTEFAEQGYKFEPKTSTPNKLVFRRKSPS